MPKYEFDSKRWCMSMSKVHHARSDFDTASTFRSVAEEIDTLRATVAKLDGEVKALREACRPVAEWWRKERAVAEPPYQTEHVVLGTDGPECVGVVELDALAALVGDTGRRCKADEGDDSDYDFGLELPS